MTKQRQRLLLDTLDGKRTSGTCTCHGFTDRRIANRVPTEQHHPLCARRHDELARQLLSELDACGPFILTAHGYRASNGQFARLAIVQAWTARQTIKGLATLPQAPVAHGLHEAHVATADDAPIRTTPAPAEQRHTERVALWWHSPKLGMSTWQSEEDGQAQHDYTTITMD